MRKERHVWSVSLLPGVFAGGRQPSLSAGLALVPHVEAISDAANSLCSRRTTDVPCQRSQPPPAATGLRHRALPPTAARLDPLTTTGGASQQMRALRPPTKPPARGGIVFERNERGADFASARDAFAAALLAELREHVPEHPVPRVHRRSEAHGQMK